MFSDPDSCCLVVARHASIELCRRLVRIPCLSVMLLGLAISGCGPANIQQPTYPVTGEVKLDGKPVKGALVVFHAVDQSKFKWQEIPQGTTDDQGRFQLFTYASNDGAPAAEYKVGIAIMGVADEDGGDQVKRDRPSVRIPAKYAEPTTSGLVATVEKRSTTLPPFELSSK